MAGQYTIFVEADAAKYLFGLRRAEREPIYRFLDWLAEYPTSEGESTEHDSVGRTVQVKLVGRTKIVYWADQADKAVKVLRIERWRR